MTDAARQEEINRLHSLIAAHNKAIAEHLEAIERLKQRKVKVKTGVGDRAIADMLIREERARQRKQVL